MCGIFGVSIGANSPLGEKRLTAIINDLFVLSETRGKEAAGIAINNGQGLFVAKDAVPASSFIRTKTYRQFMERHLSVLGSTSAGVPVAVIGHSRLVTNGAQAVNENNQPVKSSGVVGVHNGIVVNDIELWEKHPDCRRATEVDSEVILALFRKFLDRTQSPAGALPLTYQELDGVASIGLLLADQDVMVLGTNNGSLYYWQDASAQILVFSSERFIIDELLQKHKLAKATEATRLEPQTGLVLDLARFTPTLVDLKAAVALPMLQTPSAPRKPILDESSKTQGARDSMRRCTVCILPETFPFLEFDGSGVCSMCRSYQKTLPLGRDALEERVAPFRRTDGKADCIVSISGGRDSSFGLHYVKQELGLNPVSFTYDWGLVTDLARRNISRLCGRLGVENILVSADLKEKRANVRRNILAWLKRPQLGMIPLFMAGDKQFFYHGNRLARQTGLKLVFFFPNRLERTNFKSGFCGVSEGNQWYFNVSPAQKLKLASYFGKEFLLNPSYVNQSLIDTAHAFYSTYFLPNDRLLFLFDYVPWDEQVIMSTLREKYDWQRATDTDATWRIGDGTAAFYNYIYYTVAGFTEHDTFRSNQIREGLMTRDAALSLALKENQPRHDALREYSQVIGFDWDEAQRIIDAMPKLYCRD